MKNILIIFCIVLISSCGNERNQQPESCWDGTLLREFVNSAEDIYHLYLGENDGFSAKRGRYTLEKILNLESVEDIISSYESVPPYFPSIFFAESYNMFSEIEHVAHEYVLSCDSIRNLLTPELRFKLLSIAIYKQKMKFNGEYILPSKTRQTGLVLILKTLQDDNAQLILEKICRYCGDNNLKTLGAVATGNEEFNDFLVQTMRIWQ